MASNVTPPNKNYNTDLPKKPINVNLFNYHFAKQNRDINNQEPERPSIRELARGHAESYHNHSQGKLNSETSNNMPLVKMVKVEGQQRDNNRKTKKNHDIIRHLPLNVKSAIADIRNHYSSTKYLRK